MRLADLHIDRFGARSTLTLSDISDQLNVIYGPNGAGKTTLIQFIRWMIYGQRDEISRRYLSQSGEPASGSMTVRDAHGTRSLRRTSQTGSLISQLTSGSQTHANAPIGISNSEFDRFFIVSFDQPRNIGDLLNSAKSHGYQLNVDQRQVDRIRMLTEQLDRHRSELSRFANYSPVDVLRSRREEKRREIDNIRIEWQRRREELERRRNQFASDVSEQQMLTDRLRSVVQNVEAAIEGRKQQLTEEYQNWLSARRESEDRRRRRIEDMDAQANRWREILTEVRSRLEMVRERVSALGEGTFSATEATDLRFFMRKLGFRIRDIEQDLSGVYDSETWRDHESDVNYLRGLLGSALQSMQGEITTLGQTIERQQQANELYEWREEMTYLLRVERELSDLLDALSRQRHQLDRTSEIFPEVLRTTDIQSTTSQELATMLDDFRLRHLIDRRDAAAARHSEAELELGNRQRALRDVEEELARFGREGRIEILEREISEIDQQIRIAEQRHQLERTIASLEEELRRAREHTGRSEIVDEASAILQRLTHGEYRAVNVTSDHRCQVSKSEFADQYGRFEGEVQSYSQLSRGVQDQVYLALSLAIVSAYTRKGVSAPLILNDVFVNLDQSATQALASVLEEFSARDRQVLVFTRHEHIRELFADRSTRLFTLNDMAATRYEPQPVPIVSTPFVPAPVVSKPAPPVSAPPLTLPTVVSEIPPTPQDPTYQWVAEWQRRDAVHEEPKTIPTPTPKPDTSAPEEDDPPVAVSTMQLTDRLSEAATLTEDFVKCLHDLSIRTVGEFIDLDPDSVEEHLGDHGITSDMVQRRQRELLMIVYLGVSVLDAQLLVACGVPDPDRLSRADEAVLLKRIETILDRPQAAQRFGSRTQYNLMRVRRWIDLAKRSGYRGRSRRSLSNFSSRSSSESSRSQNGRSRTSRSRRSSSQREKSSRSTVKIESAKPLRFYLEINDPVVDAPSIGPKTAEKLNQVDIYTVSNLLDADPIEVANQLDDRRISSDVIEQWQLQAQLVCRIPNLRGHDAQILVACGVEDPVTLAALDASSFLKQVSQFVNSKDGQRVVRNGKKPDLAEVTAWIEWSESARQLRAA